MVELLQCCGIVNFRNSFLGNYAGGVGIAGFLAFVHACRSARDRTQRLE